MSKSKEEVMEATFRALCEHGFANLSINKIADKFRKGKSLIYYHFEDKEDLMLSFMDTMQEQLEKDYKELKDLEPEKAIDKLLDKALGIESEEKWESQKAFQEFRIQAHHNEKFQKKFQEIDRVVTENVSDIMSQAGSENPGSSARILLSLIDGAISRKVSTGDREGLQKLKKDIKKTISAFFKKDC